MKIGGTTGKVEGDRKVTRNPLLALQALGQSICLDFIRRGMFSSGKHGRRALRVHLGPDPVAGLRDLDAAVAAALDARV